MERGKKRYYWLKLDNDFFKSKEVKKLRKAAGGDTYTIIYLKMLLNSLETDGYLYFEGYYDEFSEELADLIDEDEVNVGFVVDFLIKKGLMEEKEPDEFLLTKCAEMTGSECASASRVRRHRENKALQCNTKTSQSNANQLQCDSDVTQCNSDVTQCNTAVTMCNVEKEKEKEIEIDINTLDQIRFENRKNQTVENVESQSEQAEPVRVRVSDIEFENLWEIYPRKEGKAKAKEAYAKAIRSGTTNEQIESGISDYVSYIKRNGIERRYIKQGSTWFEGQCWNDDYTDNLKPKKASYDLNKVKPAVGIQPKIERNGYFDKNGNWVETSYNIDDLEKFANTFSVSNKK